MRFGPDADPAVAAAAAGETGSRRIAAAAVAAFADAVAGRRRRRTGCWCCCCVFGVFESVDGVVVVAIDVAGVVVADVGRHSAGELHWRPIKCGSGDPRQRPDGSGPSFGRCSVI